MDSRERAWPAVILFTRKASFISSGSFNILKLFVIADLLLPTLFASSSWFMAASSIISW